MKKAVVIGIDHYRQAPLRGCVEDAKAIARLLSTSGEGVEAPTFETRVFTSDRNPVTGSVMMEALETLFSGQNITTALLYFAGHGVLNKQGSAGYLVSQDATKAAPGVSLQELMNWANRAHPNIQSTVIILDSCHSGSMGEAAELANENIAHIGSGVTILSATHRNDLAAEEGGRGLFTSILLDGLEGSASDVLGNITPASLYALIDQTLGAFEQRPIYRANVSQFITLRNVAPKIPRATLRKLLEYFPTPDSEYPLTPAYEGDRQNIPEMYRSLPIDPEKVAIFKDLQACNRQGLIVPVGTNHMYNAAIESKGCRLTAAGKHYRKLAEKGRLGGVIQNI